MEALLGDPRSQFYLGYLYETGNGVAANQEMAVSWYTEAARNECRIAECNLANLYGKGQGVSVDHEEAIRRLVKCTRPGGLCREQIGAMRSHVESNLAWYAEQGYANAQYEMALLRLDYGDFPGSAAWLQKAAQQQHVEATMSEAV